MSIERDPDLNWNKISSGPPLPGWGRKLLAWLITLFMFWVFAVFANLFLIKFPFFWRACSTSFSGSSFLTVFYYTVLSSFDSTIDDYATAASYSAYPLAGFATAIYGTLFGKPLFVVPAITWVLVYSVLIYLTIANADMAIDDVIAVWPFYIIGFLLILPCWLVSRRFW